MRAIALMTIKLRLPACGGLLFLHFQMQKDLAEAYGPSDATEIVRRVWAHLQPRVGDQLGSLPNPGAVPAA